MIHCDISSDVIDPSQWISWAKHPHAGALVYFGGITRDSFDGKHVSSLTYDAFTPRAKKSLETIAQWAQSQPGVQNVVLIHRIGLVPLSEESVCIVVAASHRGQGWDTGREMLERVKKSVEIWKKETFDDGHQAWVQGLRREPDVVR